MIGRAAIRNPWIFRQIREVSQGAKPYVPKRADLYFYCHELYEKLKKPGMEEQKMVSRMKKFLNYIGTAIMDNGVFLNQMRRAILKDELYGIFREHLLDGEKFNIIYFNFWCFKLLIFQNCFLKLKQMRSKSDLLVPSIGAIFKIILRVSLHRFFIFLTLPCITPHDFPEAAYFPIFTFGLILNQRLRLLSFLYFLQGLCLIFPSCFG